MADRRNGEWQGRGEERGRGRGGPGRRDLSARDYDESRRRLERMDRGTSGRRQAGGPGEEFGEGFWSEVTEERTRGDFNRYGDRDTLRTQPYDTDRWGAGQYGLGASGRREDMERYGWGRGWTQYQGRDTGYGTRGWDEADVGRLPPRARPATMQRPRTGYGTSGSRDLDRDMGHGAGRGGMQGASPYYEQSPELPRRGRGPRNYQRSDERIREDICDGLMQSWMDADDVTVRVHDGEVTLSGIVKSRDEKRAIEDLSEDVLGVREVHNELRVARAPSREQPRREQEQPGEEQAPEQEGRKLHS